MKQKIRIDQLLVQKGLVESRQTAQALILAGEVRIGESIAQKAGQMISPDANVSVIHGLKYVSRGGLKLEKALDEFHIDVSGKSVADIGASTGGFTDCLLQRFARIVYAVDVGYGQLAWKLQQDPRVKVMDRTNARTLTHESFPEKIDLAVIDASFIGSRKLLEPLAQITNEAVLLLKPQFEAGPADVPRGGIIRDPKIHEKVLTEFFHELKFWHVIGLTDSPIAGGSGNREFLVHLKTTEPGVSEQSYLKKVHELSV